LHRPSCLFLFIHDADLLGIVDFDARNIPNQLYFSGGADGLVLEMHGGIIDTGFFQFGRARFGNDDREVLLVTEVLICPSSDARECGHWLSDV
jgi:hypothetical protein